MSENPHELDPSVLVTWCRAVGLDPAFVSVEDFALSHDDDGHSHRATFYVIGDHVDAREKRTMLITLLPWECPTHPHVPFITRRS